MSTQENKQLGDTPAPVSGMSPRVFLDYDQSELDRVYDQRQFAPHAEPIRRRLSLLSAEIRKRVGGPERHSYGETDIEQLDLYQTARDHAPINIYIHGGAWRRGSAKGNAYLAELLTKAGANLVVPDFASVESAEDSLRTMINQVRRAIAWVYRNASRFNANPERIYLSGHSSGAHLAATALITDWGKKYGLPQDLIKGAVCCSGMYDLKGPRLSSRSAYVKFDDAMEHELSPQRHIDKIHTPLVLVYGTLETPEFQRQSRDFAEALRAAGKPVQLFVGQEYNHYEIRETFANPYGLLGRAILEQMQLV